MNGAIAAAAEDVVKIYQGEGRGDVRALGGVSLAIARGEMVALMGPSGCGKSTLLALFGCVDLPTSGRIVIDGAATSSLDDDRLTALRRDRVGTIFQFFNLLPSLTLAENVALPLRLARVDRRTIDARVGEALAAVGIADLGATYPSAVSGGQMQRAAIARAIVARPAIVLADEPTGNLDSTSGGQVLALLRSLADGGQTLLMATHGTEAASLCDRIVRMHDGRIVETLSGEPSSTG